LSLRVGVAIDGARNSGRSAASDRQRFERGARIGLLADQRLLLLRTTRDSSATRFKTVARPASGTAASRDVELERGAIGRVLRERLQLFLRRRRELGMSGDELDERELIAVAPGDRRR
jgi:hypothetical protein